MLFKPLSNSVSTLHKGSKKPYLIKKESSSASNIPFQLSSNRTRDRVPRTQPVVQKVDLGQDCHVQMSRMLLRIRERRNLEASHPTGSQHSNFLIGSTQNSGQISRPHAKTAFVHQPLRKPRLSCFVSPDGRRSRSRDELSWRSTPTSSGQITGERTVLVVSRRSSTSTTGPRTAEKQGQPWRGHEVPGRNRKQ